MIMTWESWSSLSLASFSRYFSHSSHRLSHSHWKDRRHSQSQTHIIHGEKKCVREGDRGNDDDSGGRQFVAPPVPPQAFFSPSGSSSRLCMVRSLIFRFKPSGGNGNKRVISKGESKKTRQARSNERTDLIGLFLSDFSEHRRGLPEKLPPPLFQIASVNGRHSACLVRKVASHHRL